MDERYFPTFDECPNENYPDMKFYNLKFGFLLVPAQHWCLLAEITEVEYFLRLRLWVKDRTGKEFPISFYIEEDERCLDLSRFQKGRTVAILYAEQHYFLDMTVGIRQESTSTIEVFDMPLKAFLSFCKTTHEQECGKSLLKRCDACGTEGRDLQTCAQCKSRWYCSKACQKQGWKKGEHRKDCRLIKETKQLLSFDWGNFSEHTGFPL